MVYGSRAQVRIGFDGNDAVFNGGKVASAYDDGLCFGGGYGEAREWVQERVACSNASLKEARLAMLEAGVLEAIVLALDDVGVFPRLVFTSA